MAAAVASARRSGGGVPRQPRVAIGACDDAGVTAYVASLRVYEPLAAFEDDERRYWQPYVFGAARLGSAEAVSVERAAALRSAAGRPPRTLPQVGEEAFVLEVDGVTLLCPWRTEVRSWMALTEFVADLPDEVAEAFVPRALVEQAEVALDRWRLDHANTRTHVLTCTWQVPLRWFVLVDSDERSSTPGAPGGAAGAPPGRRTGRSLVYRTPMSRARRRVARALSVLRRSVEDAAVTDGVEDLARWLEEFHPRSLVELDYGGLVHLLDDAELAKDESARDVALALASLHEGDAARAAAAYGRVTTRMKALQAVEAAN